MTSYSNHTHATAEIQRQIAAILETPGPDVADRLTALVTEQMHRASDVADAAGYRRGVARFVGTSEGQAPGTGLGPLDTERLAEEVLDILDNEGIDLGDIGAVAVLGKTFAQILKLGRDAVVTMLVEEHNRTARVATAFPAMEQAVRTTCGTILYCARLIDGGMLPLAMVQGDKPDLSKVAP